MNGSNSRLVCCILLSITATSACTQRPDSSDPATLLLTEMEIVRGTGELYQIRDLVVDEAGGLWVLSAMEPFVYRFSPDRRLLTRTGKRGNGPEEMRNPWSLVARGGVSTGMAVWDAGGRRLIGFDNAGAPEAGRPIVLPPPSVAGDFAAVSYGTPLRMEQLGASYVLQLPTRVVSRTGDLASLLLLRIDSTLATIDTLFTLSAEPLANPEEGPQIFAPIPLWATCPGGELLVLDPSANRLMRLNADGETRFVEPLPQRRRTITDAEKRTYLRYAISLELRGADGPPAEMVDRRIDEILARGRHLFAETAPPGVRLLCDASGNAWLQEFELFEPPIGYGAHWRVYRRGAEPLRVRFPDRFQPMQVAKDHVWGVYTDEMEIEHPASVRLNGFPHGARSARHTWTSLAKSWWLVDARLPAPRAAER